MGVLLAPRQRGRYGLSLVRACRVAAAIHPVPIPGRPRARHLALTWSDYAARMDLWDAIKALWRFLVLVGRFLGWLLGIGS